MMAMAHQKDWLEPLRIELGVVQLEIEPLSPHQARPDGGFVYQIPS